jgi:hypothetical protein
MSLVEDNLREDYAEEPKRPDCRFDRYFIGISPVHLMFLLALPCWYFLAPFTLGWASLGLMICNHPVARRNALILLAVALFQIAAICFSLWIARV